MIKLKNLPIIRLMLVNSLKKIYLMKNKKKNRKDYQNNKNFLRKFVKNILTAKLNFPIKSNSVWLGLKEIKKKIKKNKMKEKLCPFAFQDLPKLISKSQNWS